MTQPLQLSAAQLRCMGSAVRAQIVGALARDGPQSAREIAVRLGRSVSGLYHHIEQLERVGLVKSHMVRPSARRPEKVYALAAGRLSSSNASRTKSGRAALTKVARSLLAGASRSVGDALTSEVGVTEGPNRDTGVLRIAVRLSETALAQFNADLNALLERTQAQSCEEGKSIEFTIAIAPTRGR